MVVLFILCVAFIPVGIVSVVILSLVLVVASLQARRVEEIVNEYYRGELVPARQMPASSSPGGGISEELAKLHALRQQGVLSEEEFQRAKAKVVG
ncbi:MAG: SHOCT domain-containing protein [Deltaproteobacteria bacterium]|nr:SHOCT domain-containing protein [Deltaproteobacteria bacterium]